MTSSFLEQQTPLRVVQITDCHLGERVGTHLLNLDTDQSLAAVLSMVHANHAHIDVLLATGDISDQGSTAAYRRFLHATRDIGTHTRWLPGNHDDVANMHKVLGDDARLQRSLLLGNWQIVMLNSQIPGAVGGHFAASELVALRECLEAEPDRHTLICAHHHVIPIGCAWLDQQIVANADEFWSLIDQFSQVRAVLSGHVHQRFDQMRGDVRIFTSPSTCIQFAPNSRDFRIDVEDPGYRWFDLHANGRIDTVVERAHHFEFKVDLSASGY